MKDDKLYLIHITECLADINEYMIGGQDSLMTSKLIQDAVIRKLQVLAESTLRLSETIKASHPEVNWRAIRGFRNVVVHDYLKVNLAEVANIVAQDLPALKNAVESMLASLGNDEAIGNGDTGA